MIQDERSPASAKLARQKPKQGKESFKEKLVKTGKKLFLNMELFPVYKKPVSNDTFRHEYKYPASPHMLALLSARIGCVCKPDDNAGEDGTYTVSSLYFDTYDHAGCAENEAGVDMRSKYRIRVYNRDLTMIRLEKKHKRNSMALKTSCMLTLEQCEALIAQEPLGSTAHLPPLLRELCYKIDTMGMRPAAIIEYEREAFVDPAGNVRVTFDRNISASYQTDRFLCGDAFMLPLHPPYSHVLEVKHDELLPHYIRQALQKEKLSQTTFSKYYFGRLCLTSFGEE